MPDPKLIEKLAAAARAADCSIREDAPWCAARVRAISPPSLVAVPADGAQLAALLRHVAAERLTASAVGGGSKLHCGGIARRADLAVSTERLARVIDYPASDLTITVEAGITIRALRETLIQHGQMLPLDVPFAERATLGGTLAANLNGPRRLGYGAWRDIVIGLEFVTAEGKLAKGGGKVVKNVAGYDIPKLQIGAFGSLGIITEVSLKVFPMPPVSATYIFEYANLEAAGRAAQMIQASQFFPQALQLIDKASAQTAGLTDTLPGACSVIASIAGPAVVIERAHRDLPALLQSSGATARRQLDGSAEASLWNAIAELTPAFLSQCGGMVVKASLPLSQITTFCAEAGELARNAGARSSLSAQAGVGIAHLYLWNEQADAPSATLTRAAEESIASAERLGGRAVVEWFPLEYDGRINPWGTLGGDFTLMRQIKAALDPRGILNPGRFYEGI